MVQVSQCLSEQQQMNSLPDPQDGESERMHSRSDDSEKGARLMCGGPYKKAGPMREETEFGCRGFQIKVLSTEPPSFSIFLLLGDTLALCIINSGLLQLMCMCVYVRVCLFKGEDGITDVLL